MDDETLGKLLAEEHRDYADYRRPEGVSVSPSSMSVMVDRTVKLDKMSDKKLGQKSSKRRSSNARKWVVYFKT